MQTLVPDGLGSDSSSTLWLLYDPEYIIYFSVLLLF